MEAEDKPFKELEPLGSAPVATGHAVAAVALQLALKYHDIATVQDGTLYQQYKLEGRNFRELHLNDIFETAILMEAHLLGASERIAKLVVDALVTGVENETAIGEDEGATAPDLSKGTCP